MVWRCLSTTSLPSCGRSCSSGWTPANHFHTSICQQASFRSASANETRKAGCQDLWQQFQPFLVPQTLPEASLTPLALSGLGSRISLLRDVLPP